eukprot:14759674-Alexandrium_andersonii.AAC.1
MSGGSSDTLASLGPRHRAHARLTYCARSRCALSDSCRWIEAARDLAGSQGFAWDTSCKARQIVASGRRCGPHS